MNLTTKKYSDQVEIVPQFGEFGDYRNVWIKLTFHQFFDNVVHLQPNTYPAMDSSAILNADGLQILRKFTTIDTTRYRLLSREIAQTRASAGVLVRGTEIYGYAPQEIGEPVYVSGGVCAYTMPAIDVSGSAVASITNETNTAGAWANYANITASGGIVSATLQSAAAFSVGDYVLPLISPAIVYDTNSQHCILRFSGFKQDTATPILSINGATITFEDKSGITTTVDSSTLQVITVAEKMSAFLARLPSSRATSHTITSSGGTSYTILRTLNIRSGYLNRASFDVQAAAKIETSYFTFDGTTFPTLQQRQKIVDNTGAETDTLKTTTTPSLNEWMRMANNGELIVPSDATFERVCGNVWRSQTYKIKAQ